MSQKVRDHQFDDDNEPNARKIVKKSEMNEQSSSEGTEQLNEISYDDKRQLQKPQEKTSHDCINKQKVFSKLQDKHKQLLNQNPKQQKTQNQNFEINKNISHDLVRHNQSPALSKQQSEVSENQLKEKTGAKDKIAYQQTSIKEPVHFRKLVHIVAVSDNHGDYKMMNQILNLKGDIFIHAGDFTYQGKDQDFEKFFSFLDKLSFKHKIVISGNHENILSKLKLKTITKMSRDKILSELKKRCIYLEHQAIQIEGIKIFASPYTPEYCQKPTSRAFQYKPSQDKIIWSNIPKDIQLLITHGPPFGILDSGKGGKKAGSEALRQVVQQIKPKYHIFGHIHESKGGMTKIQNTTYINLCNTPTRFIIQD